MTEHEWSTLDAVIQRRLNFMTADEVALMEYKAKGGNVVAQTTLGLKVSTACVEDINWRPSRALDRSLVTTLAGGDWIRNAQNLLITGATGCGKTWLACALAHQAARSGFSVLYVRAGRLFDELHVAPWGCQLCPAPGATGQAGHPCN